MRICSLIRSSIFPAYVISTTSVFAHGVIETNTEQSFVERPISFFEFFISDLHAKATIQIDTQEGYRYIESDGLADHQTGRFPNSGNPNAISAQNYKFRVPLQPVKKSSTTPVGHNTFGVAINGVPFDAATAEYWNNDRSSNWNIEAMTGGINLGLDDNNAHVQPNGAYHYHSVPTGLVAKHDYKNKPLLIGYAADGFPIYAPYGYSNPDDANSKVVKLTPGYQIKQGTRPDGPRGRYDGTYTRDYEFVSGLGDLDQCNGRTGVTPEYPDGTYHYVISDSFPHVPRCWVGNNDSSFNKGRGGSTAGGRQERGSTGQRGTGRSGGPGRGGPPAEAISACKGKSENASCSFSAPHGTIRGSCRRIQSDIACVPSRR